MQSKVKGILYNQSLKWLNATLFKVNYFPLEKIVITRYVSVSSNMPPSVNESQWLFYFSEFDYYDHCLCTVGGQ